jgi:hypothetical protein
MRPRLLRDGAGGQRRVAGVAKVFLAGLAGMPLAKFVAALTAGSVPTAFAFAGIGAGWAHRPLLALAASYVIPVVLLPVVLHLVRPTAGSRRAPRGAAPSGIAQSRHGRDEEDR